MMMIQSIWLMGFAQKNLVIIVVMIAIIVIIITILMIIAIINHHGHHYLMINVSKVSMTIIMIREYGCRWWWRLTQRQWLGREKQASKSCSRWQLLITVTILVQSLYSLTE